MWGLPMCAMWVGFPTFFAGGRKKQNKFPSNLHCPVKKLNPFYFQFITKVSVWSSVFLHLLPTVGGVASVGERVTFSSPDENDRADETAPKL